MEMPIQRQPWIVGGGLFQCFAINCIHIQLKIFYIGNEIFPECVNRGDRGRVVRCTRSNTQMHTTAILSAWPDDERDRKRAPARF